MGFCRNSKDPEGECPAAGNFAACAALKDGPCRVACPIDRDHEKETENAQLA